MSIFKIVILSFFLLCCAAPEGPGDIEDVRKRVAKGEVVTVETSSFPDLSVGGIIYNCLGNPTFICMDETRRLVRSLSSGGIALFGRNWGSSTSIFSTDFFDFCCADYDGCDQFEEDIDVMGARLVVDSYCGGDPVEEGCIEAYPEECDEDSE